MKKTPSPVDFADFSQIKILSQSQFEILPNHHQNLVRTKNSFTDCLEKTIKQKIQIKLINSEQIQNLYDFELSLQTQFKIQSNLFYVREVGFVSNNDFVGFARSVLFIKQNYTEFENQVMGLKNKSLGTYLYQFKFERTQFIPLELKKLNQDFLGRSSIYTKDTSQIMISEVWHKNICD